VAGGSRQLVDPTLPLIFALNTKQKTYLNTLPS
jgi:hypothetical protein